MVGSILHPPCPQMVIKGDVDIAKMLVSQNLAPPGIQTETTLNMFEILEEVEAMLPNLLSNRGNWKSLYIDYQPPFLMRIFCDIKSQKLDGKCVRASLHYFLPAESVTPSEASSESGENLYHPHGWASSMRLIDGTYDQYIGFAEGPGLDAKPSKLCRLTHSTGDSYAMNHPWLWHQVNPRPNQAVSTLMVTHIPSSWDQEVPKSTKPLRALNTEELDFMFNHFIKFFN